MHQFLTRMKFFVFYITDSFEQTIKSIQPSCGHHEFQMYPLFAELQPFACLIALQNLRGISLIIIIPNTVCMAIQFVWKIELLIQFHPKLKILLWLLTILISGLRNQVKACISIFSTLYSSIFQSLDISFHGKNMSRLVTKPTKWHVHPAKTLINLGIRCPLSAQRRLIRLGGCPG